MTSFSDFSQELIRLYPLHDKQRGQRYRIVCALGGTTELESMAGEPRYIPSRDLQNVQVWECKSH